MTSGQRPITRCSTCGGHMWPGERVKVQITWEKNDMYQTVGTSALVCRKCGERFTHAAGLDVPEKMWELL